MIQGNTKIKIGDTIIFQGPTTGVMEQEIISLEKNHKPIEVASKGEKVAVKVASDVKKNDEVYVYKKLGSRLKV